MQITVLYFGVLTDLFGRRSTTIELPEGADVAALLSLLQASSSNETKLTGLWSSLAVAVNREYALPSTPLHHGDEVALLPPVSGGAELDHDAR